MPTEPIKPARRRECERSTLPALEKMQRLKHDRMVRSEETINRVRAAMRYEGPTKLAHYHD